MGQVSIRSVNALVIPRQERDAFVRFLQELMNRRQVGYLRYEQKSKGPHRRQRYMSRLATELRAYRKSGNAEQLLNIAMYAYLETRAPENAKFHFDNTIQSVTRHSFHGEESA